MRKPKKLKQLVLRSPRFWGPARTIRITLPKDVLDIAWKPGNRLGYHSLTDGPFTTAQFCRMTQRDMISLFEALPEKDFVRLVAFILANYDAAGWDYGKGFYTFVSVARFMANTYYGVTVKGLDDVAA